MEPTIVEQHGLRIAVEGCVHGDLNSIYSSIEESCRTNGWDGVDLVILCGDFQAVRNTNDLKVVSMPEKYRRMGDFHEYYSGARIAPYLTIFIGGNHEASNYLWELYYGGWAAPNIYYMGAANVIRVGPVRIAALSGIYKGYSFWKPHHERLPYNYDDIKSIYHVRELDTRKLLQIRTQVDVGLSHDWPNGVEMKGNHQQLFSFKPYFKEEAQAGTLGSKAAKSVLERLRPAYWFSAHLHAKYSAEWRHKQELCAASGVHEKASASRSPAPDKNPDEIDLELDDMDGVQPTDVPDIATLLASGDKELEEGIRNLPLSFFADPKHNNGLRNPPLPFPLAITNKVTRFLALDKCLPNKHFLQLLRVEPLRPAPFQRPLKLEYDKEWLAITRVFASDLQLGPNARVAPDRGDKYYRPLIEKEMEWVEQNIVKAGKMVIPQDFQPTAPADAEGGIRYVGDPKEYTNPHTQAFCELIQINNAFHASEEERTEMMQRGPRPSENRGNGRGRGGHYRGGNRARGRGTGRDRGGHSSGRGYGGGRGYNDGGHSFRSRGRGQY